VGLTTPHRKKIVMKVEQRKKKDIVWQAKVYSGL
jgi:hypothetical protein